MSKKFSSTVVGASLLLIVVNILSRGFGFLREMVFAGGFGISADFEIYLVASIIPLTINTSAIYIAQNYFIPQYHKISLSAEGGRRNFATLNFWIYLAAAAAIAFVFYIFDDFIIINYFPSVSPSKFGLAVKTFDIFALTIPINAGFSLLSAYLQAEKDFFAPAVSQLFNNISIILFVIFFSSGIGVLSIALGYLAGYSIQFLIVYLTSIKNFNFSIIFRRSKIFFADSSPAIFIIIFIEIISQLHLFIDRYFVKYIEQGGIAALNYSSILFLMPISIFSLTVSTAVFPSFSEKIVGEKNAEISSSVSRGIRIMFFVFIPLTLIYFVFGGQIVAVIFGRGNFSAEGISRTASALKFYSISLGVYAAYSIVNKVIYSAGFLKELLIITVVLILTKILLNFLFVSMNENGLALSSSMSYILLGVTGFILVDARLELKIAGEIIRGLLSTILCAAISGAAIILLKLIFDYSGAIFTIIQVFVFSVLYILSAQFFKLKTFAELKNIVSDIIKRSDAE